MILENLTIATWNVQRITPKMDELLVEIKEGKFDITMVTETKKVGKGSKELPEYILIYSGKNKEERAASGVGIIVNTLIFMDK